MMKNPLIRVAILLLASFILFGVVSLCGDGIPLWGDARLRTAAIFTTGGDSVAVATPVVNDREEVAMSESEAVDEPASLDTMPKTLLFIGDSMLDGLQPRMAAYATHNGHRLIGVRWYSSTTEKWGNSDHLQEYIAKYHPDYVLVCLGANELFTRDVKTKRRAPLQRLLSQIGDLPYVWIGPPNWKEDTGINELLEQTLAPGTYYDSRGGTYERKKDGAHPTAAASVVWCDSVCSWIMSRSAHPIRLERPAKTYGNSAETVVLQPNDK